MKPLDCDFVFDVLTRGPFPTGDASDRAVERHLAVCHECRALAEALRPAVELFHESIDPEECRDLPGYHGQPLSSGQGGLAQMVMAAIEADTRPTPSAVPAVAPLRAAWQDVLWHGPARYVGALALGALLAVLMWGATGPEVASTPNIATPMARFAPSEQGLLHLTGLNLPQTCFPSQGETGSLNAALHCCTQCHAAKEPAGAAATASSPMLMAIVSSCRSCHQ